MPRGAALPGLVLLLVGCSEQWKEVAPARAGFSVSMPIHVSCKEEAPPSGEKSAWDFRACFEDWRETTVTTAIIWSTIPSPLLGSSLEVVLESAQTRTVAETRSLLLNRLDRGWADEVEKYHAQERRKPSLLAGSPAVELESDEAPGHVGKSRPGPTGFKIRRIVSIHRGVFYELRISGVAGPRFDRTWNHMKSTFAFTDG
jgi:hypothetical protein